MNIKKILVVSAVALAMGISSDVFAATSISSAAIPVSLTLSGSCTLDSTTATATFPAGTSGVAATPTVANTVTVTCTTLMPYKIGLKALIPANYSAGAHHLVDTLAAFPDIPYVVNQAGTPVGDADIVAYDTAYVGTSLENAYQAVPVGSGAPQATVFDFLATVPAGQGSGTYTDSVAFVLAWP